MMTRGTRRILEALEKIREGFAEIPRELARLILQRAIETVPKRTGRLRRSIRMRRIRRGYEVSMGGGEAPYAGFLEYGTRGHVIRARRARALRFEIRGEVVYAKYVHHPGLKPRRIMAEAVREASRDLREIASRILRGG